MRPELPQKSPFDVPGVDLNLIAQQIVEFVHACRREQSLEAGRSDFHVNSSRAHLINTFNSRAVAASTDARSVESLEKAVAMASSWPVVASTDARSEES